MLSKGQKEKIKAALIQSLRNKLARYKPETNSMPFHTYLLGKDRMALFSFIQSLNTTFGMSIFEPVAIAAAQEHFKRAEHQYRIGSVISTEAQHIIQKIIDSLASAEGNVDKNHEIELIRRVCQLGEDVSVKPVLVDVMLEGHTGQVYLFDMKTAKPNSGDFQKLKRNLLEWTAIYLRQYPVAIVHSAIAIPYNPYHPQPYARWTMRGMLDLDSELYVGEQFWDFLGGNGTYQEVLGIFEEVGLLMRDEIDKKFSEFK